MSAASGSYGIRRTEYQSGHMLCLTCYRSWADDITPAGRCPWEYSHETDRRAARATRKRKAILAGFEG